MGPGNRGNVGARLAAVLVGVGLAAGGCSTSAPATAPAAAPAAAEAAPLTMAEMRLQEAGGPSKPARPAGLVDPVASPDLAPAPAKDTLTDAGPNTPLGKQWTFTKITGYDGEIPGAPNPATFLMSRGNGRMVGNTSCNSMTSAFEIDITMGRLRFRNLTNGNALCSRVASDCEEAVIDALIATDGFRLYQDRLLLLSKGEVVAELKNP